MDILVKAVPYLFCYFLGRVSYNVYRNKYLEDKKKELIRYHAELLTIEESLEAKDKEIRHKWQRMVDDISKYQAAVDPEDKGKWNEWDDVFLNSWSSAEKTSE